MVEKDTSATVEFFVPSLGFNVEPYIASGDMQALHHVARYRWASLALQGQKVATVIDVACGAGYGSWMLADALPDTQVFGVDYDPRAVEAASSRFARPNLTYLVGDLTTWTGLGTALPYCDALVSFDTIEHLLHRDIALMRMADHIYDGGQLLLSTPCGHPETILNPGWEHHKCEYSDRDLHNLLSRFFGEIIEPQDPSYPAAEFWPSRVNKAGQLYLNRMNPVVCRQPIQPTPYRMKV